MSFVIRRERDMDMKYKFCNDLHIADNVSSVANQISDPGQVNFTSHLYNVETLLTDFL